MSVCKQKIVLLGESLAGKTSFANRVKHHTFMGELNSTIGCEFFGADHTALDGSKYRLLIWDTAGHETFRTFTPQFVRNTATALIFYDLTDPKSIEKLQEWVDLAVSEIIIVPTKNDIHEGPIPEISLVEKDHTIHYAKPISSKNNTNIEELLNQLCDILSSQQPSPKHEEPYGVIKVDNRPLKKSSCC